MAGESGNGEKVQSLQIAENRQRIDGIGKAVDIERIRVNKVCQWTAVHDEKHSGLEKAAGELKKDVEDRMTKFETEVAGVKGLLVKNFYAVIGLGLVMIAVQLLLKYA